MTIGKRITEIREKMKMKKKEFAELIDFDYTTICKIENGQNLPSRALIESISKNCGVTVDYILSGDIVDNSDNKGMIVENEGIIGSYNTFENKINDVPIQTNHVSVELFEKVINENIILTNKIIATHEMYQDKLEVSRAEISKLQNKLIDILEHKSL